MLISNIQLNNKKNRKGDYYEKESFKYAYGSGNGLWPYCLW